MHQTRFNNKSHFLRILNINDRLEDRSADNEKKIIMGGDFNITFDTRLDCSGGAPTKKDSVKVIEDMCVTYDLIDIWRIRNPETKRFTLFKGG